MSQSTSSSERLTAVVSTLVAIAILAAGVTAHQSHNAPRDELAQMESDLRFQLDQAFRHDEGERTRRIDQLEATMQAWNDVPHSQENQKMLASWLLESTIRSMPGTTQPLPSIPVFNQPQAATTSQPATVSLTSQQSLDPSVATKESASATEPDPRQSESQSPVQKAHPPKSRLASTALPPDELPSPDPKPVKINLTELSARIAGYHEGLDQIETTLLLAETADIELLEHQTQRLEQLTRDFRFVRLYHESLSEAERRNIRPPRSMEATLAELDRLLRLSEQAEGGDFLGSFDPAYRERLERVRQMLTTIADRTR